MDYRQQRATTEELLAALVAFDTTSRLSNLDLIDYVAAYLKSFGIASARVFNEDKTKANLIATIGPGGEGGVVLSGHTDVVPVDGQAWSSNPFALTAREGRLFGRGACDMKSFLAAVLAAVPDMVAAPLKRAIHLAFSYDEEVGCLGAPSLIAHIVRMGLKPALCIVGEPTSMHVVNAHKSIRSFRTKVTGHSAHSSRTEEGLNAILAAVRLMTFLDDLGTELRARGDPSGRFDPPYTSLSVGVVQGGTAVNIIPNECIFGWEYRALPASDQDEIERRFGAHCERAVAGLKERAAEAGIETRLRSKAPGLMMPANAPEERLVLSLAAERAAGAVSYATEGGLYQRAEIPTYVCGPGDIAQAHKADEFVAVADLRLCERFLRRLMAHLS
jgi:acetylornithine deacetylase